MINLDERLLELAQTQQRVEQRNRMAQEMRDLFYALYVKHYDDEIAANNTALADMESSIKQDTLDYVAETGDISPHESVTFRRTTKLIYDKGEVLAALKEHDEMGMIRTKEELDVRAFEKAWKEGKLDWAQVEEIAAPTIAIAKLGHLLLVAQS